jgi:TRAP-type transport system small permease protein
MGVAKLIDRLSSAGGVISGICILLMSGLILLEIVLRSLTGASILICEEYAAYLLVAFGSMALAYTFKSEGHIRVDLILSKLSPRKREIVDLLCTAAGFVVFTYMVFQAWGQVHGSYLSGETSMYYSKTPLWVPQASIFVGTVLMALQLLSTMATLFRRLSKGGRGRAAEGDPSQDQR